MTVQRRSSGSAVGWAVLITGAEWFARRRLKRRSSAWLAAYGGLAILALVAGERLGRSPENRRKAHGGFAWQGLALAALGYPLGRKLVGDSRSVAPPDPLFDEIIAIEVVAAAEELTWGARVEPVLGATATAALFALKHVLVDGRWRRFLGLFLFWRGLSAQRRRWPAAALVAHAVLNAAGVIRGNLTGRDQF